MTSGISVVCTAQAAFPQRGFSLVAFALRMYLKPLATCTGLSQKSLCWEPLGLCPPWAGARTPAQRERLHPSGHVSPSPLQRVNWGHCRRPLGKNTLRTAERRQPLSRAEGSQVGPSLGLCSVFCWALGMALGSALLLCCSPGLFLCSPGWDHLPIPMKVTVRDTAMSEDPRCTGAGAWASLCWRRSLGEPERAGHTQPPPLLAPSSPA